MIMRLLIIGVIFTSILSGCVSSGLVSPSSNPPATAASTSPGQIINLPAPNLTGSISLEESLVKRRSVREYSSIPLALNEVSQLLWAAQGVTSDSGGRTAPSAGGLYPLEVYLIAGNAADLPQGVYRYKPKEHSLAQIKDGDIRKDLAGAALEQTWVSNAAVNIVVTAFYERTTQKYGDRGIRYVHMEVGHAAQNICLQAAALNLGAVTIGAFDDERVKSLLGLFGNESPLYIIPVGHR